MFDEPQAQGHRSLEGFWGIARRRRWWIFLPLFLCWGAVWTGAKLWPSAYESEAVILVEQQKVPEEYAMPNVSVDLQDRLQNMTQEILSRTRLQAMVDRFQLYSRHQGAAGASPSEDVVERMRKDIKIEIVEAPDRRGELAALKIRYTAGSPELAHQINSELTSLFIDENLKSQQQLSEKGTASVENQLAEAKAKLEEQEAKVRSFKAQQREELPSQLESNVQVLSGLRAQLRATQQALDDAQQQKLHLEWLLQKYQPALGNLNSEEAPATNPDPLDKELQDLKGRLTEASSIYTDNYPDVVALKDKIAKTEKLKKQIEDETAFRQETDNTGTNLETGTSTVHAGTSTAIIEIQNQLKANLLDKQDYQQRVKDLESQISSHQVRSNVTAETERQWLGISRGYEESKMNYSLLLQKQMQSRLATSPDGRQQVEQRRVIDPPSLPIKPSSPNHFKISMEGLLLGIAVGIGLAGLLELTHARVWQEKDLKKLLSVRVLIGIPHLSTPEEQSREALIPWIEGGALAAMFILILVGNIYVFLKG